MLFVLFTIFNLTITNNFALHNIFSTLYQEKNVRTLIIRCLSVKFFVIKKAPLVSWRGFYVLNPAAPTLPHSRPCSTIGAKELNFRVRDGNGCDLLAIATENSLYNCVTMHIALLKIEHNLNMRPYINNYYGQASRPISISKLNTLLCLHTWPINLVVYEGSLVLMSPSRGISYLEGGFPLRCFQRLSLPNLATQRCHWRDNWNTIGSSIPVLSY